MPVQKRKKKVLTVVGTRPEVIKMAMVINSINRSSAELDCVVCATAQHREMLDHTLRVFDIKPHYDLNLMKQGQSLFDVTTAVLQGIQGVIEEVKPDLVLVQGDTTSAFAAGLAAYYSKIPVGHVEAGLRTYDRYSPFPEEMNRTLLTCLATKHYAPTAFAAQNLINEGVHEQRIEVTGNTVIDALLHVVNRFGNEDYETRIRDYFMQKARIPRGVLDGEKRIILVTSHRRENHGVRLREICGAVRNLARDRNDIVFLYPVHYNPAVRNDAYDILDSVDNVHLFDPVEYDYFVYLMNKSYIILTDSGGLQEEAPSLGKPVLVLRENTERPEGVEAGVVKVIGWSENGIRQSVERLLEDETEYDAMAQRTNPYGDGRSSHRIISSLAQYLAAFKQ